MKTRIDSLLNVAIVVLCVCAVIVTSLVVHREWLSSHTTLNRATEVSNWRSFAGVGHRMGPRNAVVTIVEFSDFECPFCGALTKRLHALRQQYPNEVAIVYRHFPISVHLHAIDAVRASECAAAQGKFEAFHDAVFAAQDSIGVTPWEHFAAIAGVKNMAAFRNCSARTTPILALARDTLAGRQLGVKGTPTLLINKTRLEGAQPLDTLKLYVAMVLHPGS